MAGLKCQPSSVGTLLPRNVRPANPCTCSSAPNKPPLRQTPQPHPPNCGARPLFLRARSSGFRVPVNPPGTYIRIAQREYTRTTKSERGQSLLPVRVLKPLRSICYREQRAAGNFENETSRTVYVGCPGIRSASLVRRVVYSTCACTPCVSSSQQRRPETLGEEEGERKISNEKRDTRTSGNGAAGTVSARGLALV